MRIVRVSPHQAGKVFGVMYVAIGLLLVPLFLIPALLGQAGSPLRVGFAVVLPVLYGVLGYAGTAGFSWLYNVVAARLGGIEVVLSE